MRKTSKTTTWIVANLIVYVLAIVGIIIGNITLYSISSIVILLLVSRLYDGKVRLLSVKSAMPQIKEYIRESTITASIFIITISLFLLMGIAHLLMLSALDIHLRDYRTFTTTIGILGIWIASLCHRKTVEQLGPQWINGIVILFKHEIVTTKWFSIVRHPVYFSNLLLLFSVSLLIWPIIAIFTSPLYYIAVYIRASKEEYLLLNDPETCPKYHTYRTTTRNMLLPNCSSFLSLLMQEIKK